jgi:hypothetical protein
MRKALFGFLASILVFSCTTEVEVNAPFVETPIIYSLINSDDSLQFFRIQRAYSGANGNAIELAKDPSRIYYDTSEIELRLKLVDPKNPDTTLFDEILDVFLCDSCKEPGDFYFEDVPVYVTMNSLPIDPSNEDPLNAFLELTNLNTGVIAKAETGLVPCYFIRSPQWRCNRSSSPKMVFDQMEIRFQGPENGKLAVVTMSVLFFETPINGGIVIEKNTENSPLTLVNNVPLDKAPNFEYVFSYDSLLFGNYLNGAIDTSNNNLIKERNIESVGLGTFYFNIFNDDYYNYQLINNNFNPITQTSPIFTNVENGLGLMGGRTLRIVPSVPIQISDNLYWGRWPSIKHR